MARRNAKIGLISFVLVTVLVPVISPVNAATVGGKCAKVGAIAKTKNFNFVCVKLGKKLVWQRATTANNATKNTTTTVATEKYFAPTTSSASTDDCKLIENSVERNKYNAIFSAFPAIGGNFEPTGTFKVALVPIDWADLPGEPNPLARATDQMKIFTEWFDTVSEGKVKFVWSAYDKYVRIPGSAQTYKQSQSGAGDQLANAAIAAADPFVDFTGVRAVYFLPPKDQKVFNESSQAFKDLNLSAPIPTNEGSIMNYALAGAYFDVAPRNYWSYWAHETGHMFKLPDLKYNWNNWGQVDLPVPIGPFSGFDMLSNQDGPSRTLSSWLRWIIGWLPTESLYCQNYASLAKTTIMLNPIDNRTAGIKSAMIKISPTKIIAVESRRPASFDCPDPTNRPGVLVYIVDATIGHGEGTQTLVPPASRGLPSRFGTRCATPGILDAILNAGDSVTTNGVTVKLVKSDKYDTVEISQAG
jgi:M6 family metalloprotease-like protein